LAKIDILRYVKIYNEALKHLIFLVKTVKRTHHKIGDENTSIPITRLAQNTRRTGEGAGVAHVLGPVPLMVIGGSVKGEKTSPVNLRARSSLCSIPGGKLGSRQRDIPGFVMNRIFSAASASCGFSRSGIVSPEDVDVGMRLGMVECRPLRNR